MNMQVTSKLAKQGSRLVAIGERLRGLEERIERVEQRAEPDRIVLQRLKREKQRLKDEMHCHESLLRTLSRGLPA
ncbi:MAG: YdcH family protein [Dinoroseobacter sp.]|nr:YdcH family protein [Dinoroseobacter sp.]